MGNGRWVKGQSGNPGGRGRGLLSALQRIAREHNLQETIARWMVEGMLTGVMPVHIPDVGGKADRGHDVLTHGERMALIRYLWPGDPSREYLDEEDRDTRTLADLVAEKLREERDGTG